VDALGTPDDDHSIVGFDGGLPGGDHHVTVPHQRGEGQRVEAVGFPDGLVGDRAPGADDELRHLDDAVGERVHVVGRREARHSHDVLGGQQVRPHHEVHAQCPLGVTPGVEELLLGEGELAPEYR
jgi:hypothetical protein